MIYISTGGFTGKCAVQASRELLEAGCTHIELSSGKYNENLLANLKTLAKSVHFLLHNYFPPPASPFVLNLASMDPTVANVSIEHVKKAIDWSAELGLSMYSVHAGFLIDPKVKDLGKNMNNYQLFDRNDALDRFVERVNIIDSYAGKFGIKILLENNVLSAGNLNNFQSNPFLMTDTEECIHVMEQTSTNVELLIDVAHLKVSANSLGFNPVEFLESCSPWTGGYHLSENNGLRDTNKSVQKSSWFWPYLKRDLNYYSVEVYGLTPLELLQQRDLVSRELNK